MADLAELIVALKLRDGVSSGLGRLNGQLKGMQGGLSQVGKGIGQVGSGLSSIATRGAVAAAAGLGAVITTAASFEQAFTGVEKTVDGTDAQLLELEGTLRQMARTMPVSFEELAGIGEAGGALGIARESLDEFVDVVARLAVSTDLTSEQAATSLGQLGNVLHLTGGDFEDFADSLVALGNAGASTESQIVEMAARFGAAGNSAGLSKEEILALSSAVASMGIEVEAGGTALSQTFNNIATAIGTGSDEVSAFTDLMGISADEFKERWSKDALGTFQEFLTELSKLDQFEQSNVLEQAGITGVRQVNAIKLMTQNLGFFSSQLDIAKNATGALDTESGKFFATTAAQWQILQNNVRDAAAVLGKDLLPVVNEVMKEFVGFLNTPGTQAGLADFAKDLAAGVRGLAQELKGTDFSGIIAGVRLTAQIAKTAFDAFRSLPEPLQQLAVAAFAVNKVTGGAIGSIAAGLGNILLGSLKTIMAGNVTVIGKNVIGGGGGVPGAAGRGGGLVGGLKTGAAIAAPLLVGVAAVEVVNFQNMRNEATGFLEGKLEALDRNNVDATQRSIDKIQAQIDEERPWLEGILFNTNVRPVLEAELAELQATKLQQQANAMAAMQSDAVLISTANQQLAAQNEQKRVASEALSADRAMLGSAERLSGLQSSANAKLDSINAKDFSPTSIVKVSNFVSVSATVLQQQLVNIRTLSGSGGFI